MRDKDVESFFGGAGSRRALEASSTQAHAPDDIWARVEVWLPTELGWGLHRLTVNVLSTVSLIGDDHFYNHTWYTVQKYNSEVKWKVKSY